jgi:hypothetical protein
VIRTLYDWPIVLTGEMVYFARAAALIEGMGVRYVPGFNAITFASPVVLRMRGQILAALRGAGLDAGVPPQPDWAVLLGTLVGQAARVVAGAGRELAAVVGGGLAELFAALPPLGELVDPAPAPATPGRLADPDRRSA